MLFKNFAERLLGSKVKIKLLSYILSEEIPTSEREIARLLDVSNTAVSKAMEDFHDLNLISPLRVGTSKVWQINKQSYAYEILGEENLFKEIKSGPLQDLKSQIIQKLSNRSKVNSAYIYGSVVDGEEDAASDIDLLVICQNKECEKGLHKEITELGGICLSRYGNRLHFNFLPLIDFVGSKNKKLKNMVEKKGIKVV